MRAGAGCPPPLRMRSGTGPAAAGSGRQDRSGAARRGRPGTRSGAGLGRFGGGRGVHSGWAGTPVMPAILARIPALVGAGQGRRLRVDPR